MYEEKTAEQIKSDILAAIEKMDTREGSFADDMAGPLAIELYKMYSALNAVQPMVWVDETSGDYLDMAAADLGIDPRKAGVKARVLLLISGTAARRIAKNTTFLTTDNLYFNTEADAVIPAGGSIEVFAEAAQIGAAYNVDTGSVTLQYFSDAAINSVTNAAPALGGADAESNTSLYARIAAARRKPSTSGNVYDYEKWALEVSGVGAAKVTPIWNGPGTVKVLIADEARQPVDDRIVASCAVHIEDVRPIGAAVTVRSASALPIHVTAAITISSSTTKDIVATAFAAVFDDYLRSLAFIGYEVLFNRVGALLIGIDGVTDYSALKLNGMAQSVIVDTEQVPVVGEVTFI